MKYKYIGSREAMASLRFQSLFYDARNQDVYVFGQDRPMPDHEAFLIAADHLNREYERELVDVAKGRPASHVDVYEDTDSLIKEDPTVYDAYHHVGMMAQLRPEDIVGYEERDEAERLRLEVMRLKSVVSYLCGAMASVEMDAEGRAHAERKARDHDKCEGGNDAMADGARGDE